MKLDWLEDILAVAETGSFSEAAERRHLTQSAFSRRIMQIEDYVGVQLFDRRSKPVRLRETTESQREKIGVLASQLRQLVLDLRRGANPSANRIVIASQHALTAALAPSVIEDAQAREPDTFIKVRSANLDECLALLLSRQVDIALLYRKPGTEHPVRPDFVETVTIGSDRLVPFVGAAQADWAKERIARKELPYIAYPAEVFLGEVMEKAILSKLRKECQVLAKAETALTIAVLEMAVAGFAIAWVPLSLARARIADGTLVDLSDHLPGCELEVTAVRLVDTPSDGFEQRVWSQLSALKT